MGWRETEQSCPPQDSAWCLVGAQYLVTSKRLSDQGRQACELLKWLSIDF